MRVNRNNPMLVAITSPAYNPVRSPNAHRANRAVTQHNSTALSPTGMRAAQSCTPNSMYDTAIIQYLSGDFSRYAIPSSRGVTQSPDCSKVQP